MLRGLPIRLRMTLLFAVGTALVLAAVGTFEYLRMGADLLANIDASLGAEADALGPGVRESRPVLGPGSGGFAGSEESFAQVTDVRPDPRVH